VQRHAVAAMSVVLLVIAAPGAASARDPKPSHPPNVVITWNDVLLQAVRTQRFAPVFTARALAITHTCVYDAWASYDKSAQGVYWPSSMRRPRVERTLANKTEAISYAAYTALVDLFPALRADFDAALSSAGFVSPGPPGVLGIAACERVLQARHSDGANQLGDLHAGAYSDYTGYVPVNTAAELIDPNRWQPLPTPTGPQQFLAPQWGRVEPFAIVRLDALRPDPPPLYPSPDYVSDADHVLELSAQLDDNTKMIAEYWADGPSSETPPGHWTLIAEALSARDRHSLDDDVRMFFLLGNAMLDASIAVWDCKRSYDFVRPTTAIRFLYAGKQIQAWAGPGRGSALIDGSLFQSYIPTPPFAEYVSGHSTFSAAAAEVLRLFTGTNALDLSVTFPAGSSRIEPGITPAQPVTLSWRTLSAAAAQAGLSRRYGGIHFESADLAGRALGRSVARLVWARARQLFDADSHAHSDQDEERERR
jgi:membrane-associated phospholipid phosphatase